jgi:hypothetical protein
MKANKYLSVIAQLLIIAGLIGEFPVSASTQQIANLQSFPPPTPKFNSAIASDTSAPLYNLAAQYAAPQPKPPLDAGELVEVRPERGGEFLDQGFSGDGALEAAAVLRSAFSSLTTPMIDPPNVNFEGISNTDNFNLFGFRVLPPSPSGDVGPNHYVEMVNLAFAVYNKQGSLLLGPVPIGALWEGFTVDDCTDPSGDPIVLYDQSVDRWLLSQFTTRGPTYYNCVAISQTGDPTGAYYRYAFTSGEFFPDFPKYGVWTNYYVLTTRDFGPTTEYGVSVYALEKSKMLVGDPTARVVKLFLDSAYIPIYLMGDGLLPPDIDGSRRPFDQNIAPIVGTMDNGSPYAAPFDGLNIWELDVVWDRPSASLSLVAQLPVAEFDSIFPCAPTSRDCLPQPGIVDPTQFLDILSYRQRPTMRLAYRNFSAYESLVTSQSVEARPGIAGMRWYEIRHTNAVYSLYQQGTFAPDDGVHRWMGSVAQDQVGNIALGYNVVNGIGVFPGIRYTGRTPAAPLGQMDLGEGTIINGTGVQTSTSSRWGDYTSMNVDPADDCTFWYVSEYYTLAGQQSSTAGWQTRIASFKLPNCSFRTYAPFVTK